MKTLICIGECMIELFEKGDTAADDPVVTPTAPTMTRTFGGDTLNTAVYAARCLADSGRVQFATALGDDPFSEDMLAAWQSEGVSTDLVLRFSNRVPGLYAIRTDAQGERSFYYWRSAAPAREVFEHEKAGDLVSALSNTDMLYFSGISLAILDNAGRNALLDAADANRGSGGHTIFDTNYRQALWGDREDASVWMEKAISRSTICLPSIEDCSAIGLAEDPAALAAKCLEIGADEVVVKDGPGPCTVAVRGQPDVQVHGDVIAKPVDTTAAGDSFNGAYLAHRLMGASPVEAAEKGREMSAWVIGHKGAIVPPKPE